MNDITVYFKDGTVIHYTDSKVMQVNQQFILIYKKDENGETLTDTYININEIRVYKYIVSNKVE